MEPSAAPHDPYSALRWPDFRLFLIGKVSADIGAQMQNTAVGWQLYEDTGSALSLAVVGLVQVIPIVLLAIPAGQVADMVNRRRLLMASNVVIALASVGLAAVTWMNGGPVLLYACLFLSGVGRAFQQPVRSALVPQIVPADRFTNAVTWNVSGFQLAMVLGPALGGLLLALTRDPALVYILDAASTVAFLLLLCRVRSQTSNRSPAGASFRSLAAGVTFVFRSKVILGTLTLDLFAVLLGGATALLPIYAKDILEVGPQGLGCMRAAPSIGALAMTYFLTHRPPLERSGRALLWSVAGFGAATIVFGLSRSFALSVTMLFLTGAFDMVSVVVRHTLVQVLTPDEMRGRVSAVNGVFISISNELGAFESGLVAHVLTPTLSVVLGGFGTLAVVLAVAAAWPQVRKHGRLAGG